jgi:hypothetical protein
MRAEIEFSVVQAGSVAFLKTGIIGSLPASLAIVSIVGLGRRGDDY